MYLCSKVHVPSGDIISIILGARYINWEMIRKSVPRVNAELAAPSEALCREMLRLASPSPRISNAGSDWVVRVLGASPCT